MLKDFTKKNKLNFHDKLHELEDSEHELIEEIFTRKLNEEMSEQRGDNGESKGVFKFKTQRESFLICKEDLKPRQLNELGQLPIDPAKQKRKRRKSYVEQTPEDFRIMDEEQRLSQKQFKEQILFDRKIGHKQILKDYYKNKEYLKQQNLLQKYQELATQFVLNQELKSKLDIVQQCVTDPGQTKVNLVVEKSKQTVIPSSHRTEVVAIDSLNIPSQSTEPLIKNSQVGQLEVNYKAAKKTTEKQSVKFTEAN